MTKSEVRNDLVGAAVADLYAACNSGDRRAADQSLAELAHLLSASVAETRLVLRGWVRLPPTAGELQKLVADDRQFFASRLSAASEADLIF